MRWRAWMVVAVLATGLAPAAPGWADLTAFVGTVGFDDDANLDRSLGFGLRWGKSTGLIGGETSLMICRPERDLTSSETTTVFFYEGRILLNIPAGSVQPFLGVGLGAVTTTSTDSDVPADSDEALAAALDAVSDLQTSTAFSYGGGFRYGLNERFSLRADVRQYVVFDVKGIAEEQLARELQQQTGVEIEPDKSTVQYNEFSVGLSILF